MRFIKFLIFIAVVAAVYFLYVRDRYVSYPISTSLANQSGEALNATIRGRNSSYIFFTKAGDSRVYDFRIENLDWFSQVKILFLPIKAISSGGNGSGSGGEVSALHMKGMQEQVSRLLDERARVERRLANLVEGMAGNHLEEEIRQIDIKISKLKAQMDEHLARQN